MRGIQARPRTNRYFKFVNTINKYKKREMKIPQKIQKKIYKMSGSNSAAKIKEKIEKIYFCTVIKKIGNPLRQLLCV